MPSRGSPISKDVSKLFSWKGRERGRKMKQEFDLYVLYISLMLLFRVDPSCDCLILTCIRE